MLATVCVIIVLSAVSCFLCMLLEDICDSGITLLSFALGITLTVLLVQNGII